MTHGVSLAAVRAAVDLLSEAWAPPGPMGRIDAFGNLTPPTSIDRGCDCGGDAGPGTESVCAHTSHCYCAACVHNDHIQPAMCAVPDCALPTRLQVTPWSVQPDSTAWKSTGNPYADDDLLMPGDRRKLHRPLFACGMVHARMLVSDDRRRHQVAVQPAKAVPVEETPPGRYYEIDSWTYQPDQVDVPSPINQVPGHLEFAQTHAQRAMNALHANDHLQHTRWVHESQQSLAWALSNLTEHLEQRAASGPTHG